MTSRMKKGPVIKSHWVTHFDYWTGKERAHCSCGEIFSPRDGLTGDERFQIHKQGTA